MKVAPTPYSVLICYRSVTIAPAKQGRTHLWAGVGRIFSVSPGVVRECHQQRGQDDGGRCSWSCHHSREGVAGSYWRRHVHWTRSWVHACCHRRVSWILPWTALYLLYCWRSVEILTLLYRNVIIIIHYHGHGSHSLVQLIINSDFVMLLSRNEHSLTPSNIGPIPRWSRNSIYRRGQQPQRLLVH